MIKFLILGLYIFIVKYFSYKFIEKIDKKNRKKVASWEKEYLENFDKIYEEQYFKRLAFEKKAKEYEEIMQMKKEDRNRRLKEVGIDKRFIGEYMIQLNEAIDELETKNNENDN